MLLGQEFAETLQSFLEIFFDLLITPASSVQFILHFAGKGYVEALTIPKAMLVQERVEWLLLQGHAKFICRHTQYASTELEVAIVVAIDPLELALTPLFCRCIRCHCGRSHRGQ